MDQKAALSRLYTQPKCTAYVMNEFISDTSTDVTSTVGALIVVTARSVGSMTYDNGRYLVPIV
jgi:hypothetical protein